MGRKREKTSIKGSSNENSDGNKKPRTDVNGGGGTLYKPHSTLLISFPEDIETWYEYETSLYSNNKHPSSNSPGAKPLKPCSEEQVSSFRDVANDIYRREVQLFMENNDGKKDRWIDSTIRKGTLKDKIAAMSLSVSQDPIHSFHTLDGLLQMACGTQQHQSQSSSSGLPNSRVAHLAAEALEDLFLKTLLPPNRKLVMLHQKLTPFLQGQPATSNNKKSLPKNLSPRLLLLWRFEEMVKDKYAFFLKHYLSKTLQEGLETSKTSALRTASSLLRSVPEGEALILSLLVNKLGDPGRKLAAAAANELKLVLEEHPKMQMVIAREVQQLAHRPHLSQGALYNCITFLNQMKLETASGSNKESLPAALITTYFKFFKVAIASTNSHKEDRAWGESGSKSRLLSALLVGVNRAQPYLSRKDLIIDEHVDELYKVVHNAPSTAATQALALLFHVAVGSPTKDERNRSVLTESKADDRYYRALYSALAGTPLISSGRHSTIFFNILYKSIKYARNPTRLLAIAKRLLATALHCNSPSLAASIFVLNDLASSNSPSIEAYFEDEPSAEGGMIVLQPTIRDPQVALAPLGEAAQRSDLYSLVKPSSWELALASHHYHPSVARFSSSAGSISYDGNPLQDFGLATFLEKFAYRNPKKVDKDQKKKQFNKAVVRFTHPVKDQKFLEQQIMGEQGLFFRRFFDERDKRAAANAAQSGKKKGTDFDEEADDIDFDFADQGWESDPEEEAFYEMAAQKMLEDTAGAGPVDLDDDGDDDIDFSAAWDSDEDDEIEEEAINDDSSDDGEMIDEDEVESLVLKRKQENSSHRKGKKAREH